MRLPRNPVGIAALTTGAIAGTALGWAAERRLLGHLSPISDPLWKTLQEPLEARPLKVESFDGTRIDADIVGPDDGPTIILAHGYCLSRGLWQIQRRTLADRYRLVAYDQRGHGGSATPESLDYTMKALGRDLQAVLEAALRPGERAVVVGHSMGGMSLLSWAEQFPELVTGHLAGAVFADSAMDEVLSSGFAATTWAKLAGAERSFFTPIFRVLESGSTWVDRTYGASSDLSSLITRTVALSKGTSPGTLAYFEQLFLNCPTRVVAALGPTVTQVDLIQAAQHLVVPALVICGEHDRLTPAKQSEKLARTLPDAALQIVPKTGHHPMLEAPDTFDAALSKFVDELEAGSWHAT